MQNLSYHCVLNGCHLTSEKPKEKLISLGSGQSQEMVLVHEHEVLVLRSSFLHCWSHIDSLRTTLGPSELKEWDLIEWVWIMFRWLDQAPKACSLGVRSSRSSVEWGGQVMDLLIICLYASRTVTFRDATAEGPQLCTLQLFSHTK